MNTRKVFVDWISNIAKEDDKVILIVADVGFSYIEDFAREFPDRFLNVGVTEQSMTGIAAGLALAGFKPYVYSMIPFVTMRNYEQLRNDVCYHDANVKFLGVQGSVHYKFLGFSHNMIGEEDEKILTGLPNLIINTDSDTEDKLLATLDGTYVLKKPSYIRL
jgi:transketolase